LERLDRLAEMGLAIAAAIQQRATADEPGPDTALRHAAIDFSRVARAVRLTFALQSRLIAEFKARSQPAEADGSDHGPIEVRWLDPEPEPAAARKHRARTIVRRAAEAAGCDAETVERLVLEAGERLEDDDIHADLMTRPFDEIVALICRELGLEAPAGMDERASSPVSGGERGWPEGPEGAFRRTNGGDAIPLRSP
jgi:hypothetical protein